MKCTHCQTENREEAVFCKDCGKRLQVEVVCSKCGNTNLPNVRFCDKCGHSLNEQASVPTTQPAPQPASFANGRYQVKKFLGEGGKKKVYLTHDTVLDRDVAFALIKTEKLDKAARARIIREVQAMGRLGDHPNIVTVFDFGDHEGQPYIVLPLMSGGDVEGLIKKAADHRLAIDKALEIGKSVCKGLEFAHAKGIIHRDIKPGNVWLSADLKSSYILFIQALDLSRKLGDTETAWMVGIWLLTARSAPQYINESIRLVEELWASPRAGLKIWLVANGMEQIGTVFFSLAQRQRAETVFDELRELAKRSGNITTWVVSAGIDASLAVIDGRLEDAMDMIKNIQTRLEYPDRPIYMLTILD